jgi:hypothetical protein
MRKQVQGYEDGINDVPEENGSGMETLQMPVRPGISGLPGTTQSRGIMAKNAFNRGAVNQTSQMQNQAADQFGAQTGYKPGTALSAGEMVNPVSETGAVATSPTALQAPSVGTAVPGVQRLGSSFSKMGTLPKIADTTGVQSTIGAVTQPVTTGIMRGFSNSKVPGVQRIGNSYSKSRLPVQGYASGTEEVPDTRKIIEKTTGVDKGLVRPSVPVPAGQAAAQAVANEPHGPVQPFESVAQPSSGIYKRKPSSMRQLVPVGEGSTPTVKEPVSVKDSFFTEPKAVQPGFTAQPNYEGTIPPNKQVSVIPKAVTPDTNPWGDSISGKEAIKGAKGILGKAAGTLLGGLGAAQNVYAAAQNAVEPSQMDEFLKAKAAKGDTKAAEVLASGGSNPIMESLKSPVRDRLNAVGDTASSLGDRVVSSLTPETAQGGQPAKQKDLPEGTKLQNGMSVGDPDQQIAPPAHNYGAVGPAPGTQEAPITEFSGNGVNLAQGSGKQDKRGIFGANTKEKSEALQRTIDYNAKPETQAMFAKQANIVADRKAKSDASFAADRAQQPQQVFVQGDEVNPNDEYRSQLENEILNKGPNSRMSVGQFAAAKHKRAAALGILAGLDSRENAQRQADQNAKKLAMEAQQASTNAGLKQQELAQGQKNIEATNASTTAQQVYNRQHQDAVLAETKRGNDFREEAVVNRPHESLYLGEPVKGTPEEIENQKAAIDKNNFIATKAKQYGGELFTGKQGGQERAEKEWASGAQDAKSLSDYIAKHGDSKEQKDDMIAKFQSQYGVPYSRFLAAQ